MSVPAPESMPKLRPGCRLSEQPGQQATLMIPEGALQLTGPAPAIVQLCDGARTFDQMVGELALRYPGAGRDRIAQDAAELLATLKDKRALDY